MLRYLALVSDGITEFMGSQEIIDRVHKWASAGTMPHEVARRLVREARDRWREMGDEGIVDDCTAIVAYLVCDCEEDDEEEEDEDEAGVGGFRTKGGGRLRRRQERGGGGGWIRHASALWAVLRRVLLPPRKQKPPKQSEEPV
jgi:hypothetical protein